VTARRRPAARSQITGASRARGLPEAAVLAAVRPLGPGSSEERLGWAGAVWVWPGGGQLGPWAAGFGGRWWPRLAPGLAPLPPPRTGAAYRLGAEAARVLGSYACSAAPSTCPGMERHAHPLAERLQTGTSFLHLHMPIFITWPGLVPIQTGASA
jgi:hypothetical protein